MRATTIIILVALVSACSANPKAGEPDAPVESEVATDAVTPFESEWEQYRDASALPVAVPLEGMVFQEMLRKKLMALKQQEGLYAALLTADDVGSQSKANFGSARLYLNLGCELATFAPPSGLNAAQAKVWSDQLHRVAGPMISKAQEKFAVAANMDGGIASERATEVNAALSDDLVESCQRTEATWAAASRPEPEPVDDAACIAEARQSKVTRGCQKAVSAACREGEGEVCEPAGDYAYEHDAPDQALELWSIGCDKHHDKGACGARSLTARPQFITEYEAECTAGDVLGCLKLARLAEQKTGPVAPAACTAAGAIGASTGSPARCASGDAASCWVLVAKQLAATPMPAIEGVGGLLGSLIGGAPTEELMERFERGCAKGRGLDCMNVASATEGKESLPWLEKACAAGVGCGELGEALVELDVDVSRGSELLVTDCVERSRPNSCSAAARLFMDGKALPKSAACAAALGLQTCTPIESWDCMAVNHVFHPSK